MKNWCIFPLSSLPCTSNWCFSYKWGPATSHKDCFDPMRLQPPTNHRAGSHPIMQLPPHLIRINKGRLVDYLPTCLQRARQQPEILAHLMAGLGAMCKHDPGAKLCSLWDSEPGEIYPSFQHFNSKCENIMFIMITQQHWLQREKKNTDRCIFIEKLGNLCIAFPFLRPCILYLVPTDTHSSYNKPAEVPRLENQALKHFTEDPLNHSQAQVWRSCWRSLLLRIVSNAGRKFLIRAGH